MAAVAAAAVPMTVPGPQGRSRRHFRRRRQRRAGRADHSRARARPTATATIRWASLQRRTGCSPRRLAAKGVSTLRADKRGMFGSKAAISGSQRGDDRRLCRRCTRMGRRAAQAHRREMRLAARPQRRRARRARGGAAVPRDLRGDPRRFGLGASSAPSFANSSKPTPPMRRFCRPRWRRSNRSRPAKTVDTTGMPAPLLRAVQPPGAAIPDRSAESGPSRAGRKTRSCR